MNESKFIVLLGSGNHFHGEGLKPKSILSFIDTKDMWLFWDLYDRVLLRICSSTKTLFDDAFLFLTLKHHDTRDGKNDVGAKQVYDFFVNAFNVDFDEKKGKRKLDWINFPEIFEPHPEKARELYDTNRHVFPSIGLKLVGVQLAEEVVVFGPGSHTEPATVSELFLQAVDNYYITNAELCTQSWGRISGVLG